LSRFRRFGLRCNIQQLVLLADIDGDALAELFIDFFVGQAIVQARNGAIWCSTSADMARLAAMGAVKLEPGRST
jgi:hypothetical protein